MEMRGGKVFSKLDIKQAYNHIKLRECDQILTTINTHKGLYKWTCLSYGLAPSSGIFQATMDEVLKGLTGVTCRVDDILIQGSTVQENIDRVDTVLERLKQAGFRCGWEKSEFLKDKIMYLGYEVSADGVKACRSKVETLLKAPYPDKLTTLVSFLGAVQYYARFIPQMSTLIEPLNSLRTSKTWTFGKNEKKAFDELKELLASNQVLTFYDPDKPVRVAADASDYGIGAVISHIDENGQERPVEFISRTLTKAERNYSQIEKEALSIVWSIKRFHRYLYARPFELYTDHKPLEFILDSHKMIPEMGTSRIIRWALVLSHYQYKIKHRPTKKHSNADFCSRYPLPETDDGIMLEEENDSDTATVFSMYINEDKPLLNSELISKRSVNDPIISKVMYHVKEGWSETYEETKDQRPVVPEKATTSGDSSEMKAFYTRRTELSTESGCLLWGHRVVIPKSLRDDVMKLLHSTHMGMSAMKSLARNYVWWPKLDNEIENLVRHCETCQMNQRQPNKSIPHPWRPAKSPWERVHLDFAGPYMNGMWMLVIDVFSKWVEVVDMRNNTTSENVIRKLRTTFSRYGLPKIMVTDNGPQLVSGLFELFCKQNGINHIATPSYHPASNGQIESIVGKFKAAMNKMQHSNKDMGLNIANWLLNYHNTPHSVTGVEPAVRMLGRRLRSALSLVHPLSSSKEQVVEARQEQRMMDGEKRLRRCSVGDKVLYRDVLHNEWRKGTVSETSDKQYGVITESGLVVKKHIDHIVAYHERERPGTSREVVETADRYDYREFVQPARPTALSNPPVDTNSNPDNSHRRDSDIEQPVDNSASSSHEPRVTRPIEHTVQVRPTPLRDKYPARAKREFERFGYDKLGGRN